MTVLDCGFSGICKHSLNAHLEHTQSMCICTAKFLYAVSASESRETCTDSSILLERHFSASWLNLR